MATAASISISIAAVASSTLPTSLATKPLRRLFFTAPTLSIKAVTASKSQPKTLNFKSQNPLRFLLPRSSSFSFKCLVSARDDEPESGDEPEKEEEEEEEEDNYEEEEEEGEEEEEEEEDDSVSSSEGRRLYVGNLPFSMTSSQLAEVFQEAGSIESVEVIYDRVTDRSRGFAFVTMGSVEEAKQAMRMFNGSQVGGRSVRVNFPEVPRGGEREVMGPRIRNSYRGFIDSPYKIYAGNLGWSLTSESLREAFASQPGLLSAKVIYDRATGRSRGFGFVSFGSLQEAQLAVEAMNGVEVDGRPLRLNLAEQRTTASTSQTQEMETGPVQAAEMN